MEGEQAERINVALSKLSPWQPEVIDLVHFQQMRVGEVGRQMEKSPGATSVLLHQALNKLREVMTRQGR